MVAYNVKNEITREMGDCTGPPSQRSKYFTSVSFSLDPKTSWGRRSRPTTFPFLLCTTRLACALACALTGAFRCILPLRTVPSFPLRNVLEHGRHGNVAIHAFLGFWWHGVWFAILQINFSLEGHTCETHFMYHCTIPNRIPAQTPLPPLTTSPSVCYTTTFSHYRVGDTIRKRARLRLPRSSTVGGDRGRMPLGRVWFVTYSRVSLSNRFVYDRHEDRMTRPDVWML